MAKIEIINGDCIRVFPRKTEWTPTDELSFVGDPPLFRPQDKHIPVKVSVCFTWDIPEGERLARAWNDYYDDVQIGGPAFGDRGEEFIPNRFIKEGVTITSRGCIRNCPWCHVPKREGKIRELQIKNGWIVQDNNILACSKEHIRQVFIMLKQQNKSVTFSGGIDARLLKPWHIALFNLVKIKELWFACDSDSSLKDLQKASELLSDFSINKKRCYVMIGYDETITEAERRLEKVYRLGFLPFAQLFQPENKFNYSKPWRDLNRYWSRPEIFRSKQVMTFD